MSTLGLHQPVYVNQNSSSTNALKVPFVRAYSNINLEADNVLKYTPSSGTLEATTFVGAFAGTVANAVKAETVDCTTDASSSTRPIALLQENNGTCTVKKNSAKLSFNLSTETLNCDKFSGTAANADDSTNASNVVVGSDTTTDAELAIPFVTGTGTYPIKVDASNFTYHPSDNILRSLGGFYAGTLGSGDRVEVEPADGVLVHSSSTGGGYDPLLVISANTLSSTGWDARIRVHNTDSDMSSFLGIYYYGSYQPGVFAHAAGMTQYEALQVNTINVSTNAYYSNTEGQKCGMKRLMMGCHPSSSVTAPGNDSVLEIGRSTQAAVGITLGGYTGAASSIQCIHQCGSIAYHVDGPSTGDFYLNYFAYIADSARRVRVYGFINASDARLKKDFTPYDDDELMSQIMNLDVLTYYLKDPAFVHENASKTLGFIADSLEHSSYFKHAFAITKYNIPYDNPIQMEYKIVDDLIVFSNYSFNTSVTYYWYAFTEGDLGTNSSFKTIESEPVSAISVTNPWPEVMYTKIYLIGELKNDCKNICKTALVAGAYAGCQILNRKYEALNTKYEDLLARVTQIEQSL